MEKYLISLTIRERVEPAGVTQAVIHAAEEKHALVLLGTKGSYHSLFGKDQVGKYPTERYQRFAELGLLYVQQLQGNDHRAFASTLDPTTGLPVLMEEYGHAFAMRSKEGAPKEQAQQATLELPTT